MSTVLFIHGLGADSNCFRHAFETPALRDHRLIAPDLPGFGGASEPQGFGQTMLEHALSLEAHLGEVKDLVVVGHSMGGVIALLLAERLGARVRLFVNAVGNLVPEDCFWSRSFIAQSPASFQETGFPRFKGLFKTDPAAPPPRSTYALALEKTSASVMQRAASDLVYLCDQGHLLERFLRIPCTKVYFRDEQNQVAPGLEERLVKAGVPVRLVPGSGHALMEDNPHDFYRMIADYLDGPALPAGP